MDRVSRLPALNIRQGNVVLASFHQHYLEPAQVLKRTERKMWKLSFFGYNGRESIAIVSADIIKDFDLNNIKANTPNDEEHRQQYQQAVKLAREFLDRRRLRKERRFGRHKFNKMKMFNTKKVSRSFDPEIFQGQMFQFEEKIISSSYDQIFTGQLNHPLVTVHEEKFDMNSQQEQPIQLHNQNLPVYGPIPLSEVSTKSSYSSYSSNVEPDQVFFGPLPLSEISTNATWNDQPSLEVIQEMPMMENQEQQAPVYGPPNLSDVQTKCSYSASSSSSCSRHIPEIPLPLQANNSEKIQQSKVHKNATVQNPGQDQQDVDDTITIRRVKSIRQIPVGELSKLEDKTKLQKFKSIIIATLMNLEKYVLTSRGALSRREQIYFGQVMEFFKEHLDSDVYKKIVYFVTMFQEKSQEQRERCLLEYLFLKEFLKNACLMINSIKDEKTYYVLQQYMKHCDAAHQQ